MAVVNPSLLISYLLTYLDRLALAMGLEDCYQDLKERGGTLSKNSDAFKALGQSSFSGRQYRALYLWAVLQKRLTKVAHASQIAKETAQRLRAWPILYEKWHVDQKRPFSPYKIALVSTFPVTI
jgi:hypothetical protein